MQYTLLLSDMYFKCLLYRLHLFLENKIIKFKIIINIMLFVGLKIEEKTVKLCSICQGQENFLKRSMWFHRQVTQKKVKYFKINL